MGQKIGAALSFILLVLAGTGGYFAMRAHLASEIYRDRLVELSQEYEQLAEEYRAAVRKSAVTELRVFEGKLSVIIRTSEGVFRELETPYDPTGEIYVDYVVLNNRLWIRRVFDQHTSPSQGIIIDPRFVDIDWQDRADEEHGKAVYRRLSEGRWAITVTGSGALGLQRISADARIEWVSAPEIRDFSELEESIRRDSERIGPVEIARRLVGR